MRIRSQRGRMEARARRRASMGNNLNLVALIDIFTNLLLFLLIQVGDAREVLPYLSTVNVPQSQSQSAPRRELVVAIDMNGDILLEGNRVASAAQVREAPGDIIPGLSDALHDYLAQAAAAGRESGQKVQGRVVVMGDRDTPFAVLRRVMATCAASRFGEVSLAVQQREAEASPRS